MTDHDEALDRARRLLAQPVPQRTPPARMHQRAEPEWTDWPQERAPTVSMWTSIDKRISARLDTVIDAIGASLARRGKGVQEELAKRDAKIAALEKRLAALEGERPAPPNVAHLITGGRKDAA